MNVFKSPIFKAVLPTLMIFLVLRLVFWLNTFPNPDEAYYWLWGQHPDFSYYDHPPFQAWVEGVFTALFGRSFFVLRLPNLISNGIFFYTYYRITKYLYGENYAPYFWLTISLILSSPLYFLFLALAWHDHWLIAFSLLAAFQFIQFLDRYKTDGKNDWQSDCKLYRAAVALGLALLCKYNAVFVAMGLLAAVLSNQKWRELLRDRRLYIAILITLSFLLPILVWNLTNDWQSWRYYIDRSVDNTKFRLKWNQLLNFLLFSTVLLSPIIVWTGIQGVRRTARSTYQTVALWIFAVSTLTLVAVSLVSTALYYWNITAYLLLFPLLPGVFLRGEGQSGEGHEARGTRREAKDEGQPLEAVLIRKPMFYGSQIYGLLFAVLLVVHYSVLPLSAFGDPQGDPDSRMLFGWSEVAAIVRQQIATIGDRPFLVTTDYRSASALAYQLRDPSVLAISDRVDQFDFWYDAQALQGRNAIVLADDWHPVSPELLAQFERTSTPITLPIRRFGVWIKNYYVLRGYGFKGMKAEGGGMKAEG